MDTYVTHHTILLYCDLPLFVTRLNLYWPTEKWARRFLCQQLSLDSVQTGRSLP